MIWLVLVVIVLSMAILFATDRIRRILIAIAIIVVGFIILFTYLSDQQNSEYINTSPSQTTANSTRSTAVAVTNLSLSEISLAPASITTWTSAGTKSTRQDPSNWQLSLAVTNHLSNQSLTEVGFLIRLFSCPDSFNKGEANDEARRINLYCTNLGSRQSAFYNLDIAPGNSQILTDNLRFEIDGLPRNWHYLIDPSFASATQLP